MHTYFNDVNDWLSVGGDLDLARDVTGQKLGETITQLRAHGVTHVLDLRSEWDDAALWRAAGLPEGNYRHAPIVDSWRHIPPESWCETVEDFIRKFWEETGTGSRLYIHCHMGINRAPSAAMLALLTIDPDMDPMRAFLRIREARPAAGLVYAEAVGIRHLLNREGFDEFTAEDTLPDSVIEFSRAIDEYWTPALSESVRRGIAFYRSAEGHTIEEGRITGAPLWEASSA